MTNNDAKELALALLNSDSEMEVIGLLEKAGLWDEPGAWRLVGDRDGNFATIGSQQSRPEAALVEKIVNSVDARLMNECLIRGIDPKSEDAPPSIRHAVARFFEDREPAGEIGGTIQTWSQNRQLEQSQFITVAVTGAKARSGYPCITIADAGEGQTPKMIPETFLSIDRNNKLSIHFVQGKFNMGGTGALRFCGEHSLQLLLTKRNPAILATQQDRSDPTEENWGFTVVRRRRPLPGAGRVKNSVFSYLAPVNAGSSPGRGDVLSFGASALALMPENNRPYEREISGGSVIKLYEYDMKGFRSHVLMRGGLLSRLELLLPSIALPARVHECRSYRGAEERSFANSLVGVTARLEQNRGDNLEAGFPTSARLAVQGERMVAQIYAFREDRAKGYRTNEGIIFVVNGQTHGLIPATFFERGKVKMGRLAKSLLVVVDCTGLSVGAREDLFMNSRDRLSNSEIRKAVEEELQDVIGRHSGLRELRDRRRFREIEQRLRDSRPLEEVIGSILKSSPTLERLFALGERLSRPHRSDRAGGGDRGGAESGDGGFRGRKHPTFFRFHKKPDGRTLARNAELGRRCRIRFETDVENEYFSRPELPGHYYVECLDGPLAGRHLDHSLTLHNGIANWSITLPEEDLGQGDDMEIRCTVTDEVLATPLVNHLKLTMTTKSKQSVSGNGGRMSKKGSGAAGAGGGGGKSDNGDGDGDRRPGGLRMPTIVPVRENDENWARHEFDGKTGCKVLEDGEESGEGDGSTYTFYVNEDNIYLKTEMKSRPGDVAAMRAKFIYGNVLVGLALIHDRGGENDEGADAMGAESGGEETLRTIVEKTTRAVGPFLIPMIEYLGALSGDEVGGSGQAGDEE